jgi:hypothetical protein
MNVIAKNLYTDGNEFKTAIGTEYRGEYHIYSDGTIMSGPSSEMIDKVQLYPILLMPTNDIGEYISEYDVIENDFNGEFLTLSIKNYKNDIQDTEISTASAPIITLQPDLFFRRKSALDVDPGAEILIDENRTIIVSRGKKITLDFNFESSEEDQSNIIFEWKDSYDRVVYVGKKMVIDTNTANWKEETFHCTITDSYGSVTTNDITVELVDINNSPWILNNIIQNGSANNGTADWETNGDAPEDVGKFIENYEQTPNGILESIDSKLKRNGTYFYHKLISGWEEKPQGEYKNQWYPRPEIFDEENNFNGTVASEIKQHYFRGGIMYPVLIDKDGSPNRSGVLKTSTQVIDLSEISDLIEGKVYGIRGFRAVMFGWLGGRADQGDRVSCTFDFLDENDNEIVIDDNDQNSIRSRSSEERASGYIITSKDSIQINPGLGSLPNKVTTTAGSWFFDYNQLAKKYPWINFGTKLYQGYIDPSGFEYSGLGYDFNSGRSSVYTSIYNPTTNAEKLSYLSVKTAIVGDVSTAIIVPDNTRKIRVTKVYQHVGGIVDLVYGGNDWSLKNQEYVSDAMIAGLNLRLYPVLLDNDNTIIDMYDAIGGISGMDFDSYVPSNDEKPGYKIPTSTTSTLPVTMPSPRSMDDFVSTNTTVAFAIRRIKSKLLKYRLYDISSYNKPMPNTKDVVGLDQIKFVQKQSPAPGTPVKVGDIVSLYF